MRTNICITETPYEVSITAGVRGATGPIGLTGASGICGCTGSGGGGDGSPGAPGSGVVKGNGGGIVGIGGDGEELRVTITNMASGNLIIVVDYYTIES